MKASGRASSRLTSISALARKDLQANGVEGDGNEGDTQCTSGGKVTAMRVRRSRASSFLPRPNRVARVLPWGISQTRRAWPRGLRAPHRAAPRRKRRGKGLRGRLSMTSPRPSLAFGRFSVSSRGTKRTSASARAAQAGFYFGRVLAGSVQRHEHRYLRRRRDALGQALGVASSISPPAGSARAMPAPGRRAAY